MVFKLKLVRPSVNTLKNACFTSSTKPTSIRKITSLHPSYSRRNVLTPPKRETSWKSHDLPLQIAADREDAIKDYINTSRRAALNRNLWEAVHVIASCNDETVQSGAVLRTSLRSNNLGVRLANSSTHPNHSSCLRPNKFVLYWPSSLVLQAQHIRNLISYL